MININKFIAASGLTSRRGADALIKAGRVKINGKVAQATYKVVEGDVVTANGQEVVPEETMIYLAFNKPVGLICTTDTKVRDNIISYIKYPKRVFPVGRLDVASSGLILLTNDGELSQEILKGKKVEKEYLVYVDKAIDEGFLNNLRKGIVIDGHKTLPAKAEMLSERHFSMCIMEGKKRQIRRMCERFGYNVTKLQRIRIGKLELGDMKAGKFIEIPATEIKKRIGLE